ncbi:MAG: NADH-quinone oxidoreductase subunit L [Thermoprotei archaeon]|nr:MAG: NADH-quinone oxidoreductase subunit L [Thermoprotei archaeon]
MEYWEILAWSSWIFPIAGALLTPVMSKINQKLRDYAAILFSMLAAVSTVMLIPLLFSKQHWPLHSSYSWIVLEGAPIFSELKVGVIVDPLSIIMANVVAIISFLIMIYSLGYMHGDPSLTRYWFFMNFFIGNMLLLVFSENLVQMLFGWEGVGLCSYALIGFWYRDSKKDWLKCWVGEGDEAYPPSHCGMKAFLVTRLGDVFMLVGAFIILVTLGTLSFTELAEAHISREIAWIVMLGLVFLFFGPVGKSAQLPLMEWLPDAMAGPTTVSALIHAATMVKAGVYLVARLFPIVYSWSLQYPEVSLFFAIVMWIGVITAFVAATQAVVSTELKKVLAYSTVSQLGYMMMALGAGGLSHEYIVGYVGGVFHLLSHALFKAALFLSAGAVLHATESRFLRDFGGLKRYMPKTFLLMTLAVFSLMGVPLFSGFWSKDAVLESALISKQYLPYIIGVVTAALTAFYSIRMIGLTFFGHESNHIKELEKEGRHVHEAPFIMLVPIAVLVLGTVAFGISGLFTKNFLEHTFHEYLSEYIQAHASEGHGEAILITLISSIIALALGAVLSYATYIRGLIDPIKFISSSNLLKITYHFLYKRWFLNKAYYVITEAIVREAKITLKTFELGVVDRANYVISEAVVKGSKMILKIFELGVIDRINYVITRLMVGLSRIFRKSHTGVLNYNVIGIISGILMLVFMLLVFR